jgi:hypothetical protein
MLLLLILATHYWISGIETYLFGGKTSLPLGFPVGFGPFFGACLGGARLSTIV